MNFTVTTAREKKWVADWSRERENNEIRQVYYVSSVVYRLQLPRDKQTPKPTRPSHVVLAEVPGGTGCPELCPLVSVCCHSTEGPCLVDSRHFQKPLAAQGALRSLLLHCKALTPLLLPVHSVYLCFEKLVLLLPFGQTGVRGGFSEALIPTPGRVCFSWTNAFAPPLLWTFVVPDLGWNGCPPCSLPVNEPGWSDGPPDRP